MHQSVFSIAGAILALSLTLSVNARSGSPFASEVISYSPGANAAPGYTNPATSLGEPERFTGEGIFPSVVSAFSPPFGVDEIVSIGAGGHLVLRFASPVTDDPNNLYGIDLIIFSNAGFIDASFPNGVVGGLFGDDGGMIELSQDGLTWHPVPAIAPDGPMPTIGYMDAGPFDQQPGTVLTDFTRPVDPALTVDHFLGLNNAQVIDRYRGSGGGVGIDISITGLAQISYVRISNPAAAIDSIEIDAVADAAPRMPGDVNLDGAVNIDDLLLLIGAWGKTVPGGPPADFDNNGVVNIDDLLVVISNWSFGGR